MLETSSLQRSWREANHSPHHIAKVKNEWSNILTSPYVFMAWCLITGTTFYFTSNPFIGLDRPLWFQEAEAARISRQSVHERGEVVSPKHRPPLPPRDTPGIHFS